jgi:hypothetical protein
MDWKQKRVVVHIDKYGVFSDIFWYLCDISVSSNFFEFYLVFITVRSDEVSFLETPLELNLFLFKEFLLVILQLFEVVFLYNLLIVLPSVPSLVPRLVIIKDFADFCLLWFLLIFSFVFFSVSIQRVPDVIVFL